MAQRFGGVRGLQEQSMLLHYCDDSPSEESANWLIEEWQNLEASDHNMIK